ncbi:MAG: bifunctional hydroxymethylpyrimidine kinase/phosphomethylpyrimidine kinase, partial [Kiritimatiellae bacterium]|nr:bifunctional hydroxymethylpyrimidine kinase/phosphomethylpyrimidine kinase [Kiritimatiellia bacterium]
RAEIEELIAKLHALGAKNVILTGVSYSENELGSAISDGTKIEYDFNPRLNRMSHGTGDVFASVFAGAIMRGKSALDAASIAADIVCEAIKATEDDHWYGVSFEKVIPELVKSF